MSSTTAVLLPSCLLVLCAAAQNAPQAPTTLSAERAAFMRTHFASVMDLHQAVVRGDVETARSHARAVANRHEPLNLPAATEPYIESMRRMASRAASEDELDDIAAMSASMLAACGDCHRAAGVMPALPAAAPPRVIGGGVGHMLEHQQAVDLLVEGLTVPSESQWVKGARRLAAAPMHRRELPRDSTMTPEIVELEKRVHQLATRAREHTDTRSRIYYYSEIVQSCGTCHALHGNVWGPDRR